MEYENKPPGKGEPILEREMRMDIVLLWQKTCAPYLRARFGGSERGAALVEYALLLALIAVFCIAALSFLGGEAKDKFNDVGNSISGAGTP